MTLDGQILRGLFNHEKLKPVIIRTSQGNVYNLLQLKQVVNIGMTVQLSYLKRQINLLINKISIPIFLTLKKKCVYV